MTYMLLLTRGAWQDEDAPAAEREKVYERIGAWWGARTAEGTIVGGEQLAAPELATTLVIADGGSTVLDGPFLESKETIGGYALLDVPDAAQAIAVARTFPVPDGRVEVRPIVVR
ncbi:MAG: YciI family protein [Candidatus Dormiibacterota bacterium]